MNTIKSICVYCGSSPGRLPAYAYAARTLGAVLVAQDIKLVYPKERRNDSEIL